MTEQEQLIAELERPKLVFVYSSRSGRSRVIDGYLAQVLQHRHNHDTFALVRIDVEKQPELAERLEVTDPKGRAPIADMLSPWLK